MGQWRSQPFLLIFHFDLWFCLWNQYLWYFWYWEKLQKSSMFSERNGFAVKSVTPITYKVLEQRISSSKKLSFFLCTWYFDNSGEAHTHNLVSFQRCLTPHHKLQGSSYPRDSVTNISPRILKCMDRNLHLQPSHPLCLIKQRIANYMYKVFDKNVNKIDVE